MGLKRTGKVALIVKTAFQRRLGKGPTGSDQTLREVDAQVDRVLARRESVSPFELTNQVKLCSAGWRAHVVQTKTP